MAENIAAINLAPGLKADRKLEMIFVNMGTSETAEWEILGRGVEESTRPVVVIEGISMVLLFSQR